MARDEENGTDHEPLENFAVRLKESVEATKVRDGYSNLGDAFVHWALEIISPSLSHKEIATAVATRGASEKGIDAAWHDSSFIATPQGPRPSFVVAQGKYGPVGPNERYGDEPAKDLLRAYSWLTSNLQGGRSALKGVKSEFFDRLSSGEAIRFLVLIPGSPTESLKEAIEAANQGAAADDHGDIRFEIYDIERLFDAYLERITEQDVVPEVVQFKVQHDYKPVQNVPGRAIVAEIPILELYRLVKGKELELFHRNLRVHLATSRYNTGIREVIRSGEERENFWYYNNGITAICNDFQPVPDYEEEGDLKTLSANRLQIVNGCQTCVSIANEVQQWEHDGTPLDPLRNVSVLMRIIAVGNGSDELESKIARYTNSQTPITGRDLSATDPRQAMIRDTFKNHWNVFLEVKKDEWKTRTARNRGFKSQFEYPFFVPNDRIGQYFMAFWLNQPASAKSHKKRIFDDQQTYRLVFGSANPDEAYGVSLYAHLLAEEWRKSKGFGKRRPAGVKKRSGRSITKGDVMRHADLMLLSSLGASLKMNHRVSAPRELQKATLKAMADRLRSAHPKFQRDGDPGGKRTQRELYAALDRASTLITKYVKDRASAEGEKNVRNILVRDSSWADFEKTYSAQLQDATKKLLPWLSR